MKRKKASKKINKDYVDKNGLYFWGKFFSWKELFSGKYPDFLKNKTKHQKLTMDSIIQCQDLLNIREMTLFQSQVRVGNEEKN